MVQVKINFSNKTFYTIIAILAVVLITGIAYAIKPNPGHSINEIENFNQSVRDIVNEALGISSCGNVIYESGALEVKGYTSVSVNSSCITQDNSNPGCTIIQEILDLSVNVIIRKQTDYSQGS
ncbi:MAG: hypothetical protein NT076_03085, partial [Candidatus Pacearchaeota archaeon]|nr:hypothetical protein [Candidatus Pacearchaeota archaeon]